MTKEEMATQYEKSLGDRMYGYHAKAAYLAGFDRARNLLAQKWKNHCTLNPCRCDDFVDDCESLGEEKG